MKCSICKIYLKNPRLLIELGFCKRQEIGVLEKAGISVIVIMEHW
jgi:hypothetical protein